MATTQQRPKHRKRVENPQIAHVPSGCSSEPPAMRQCGNPRRSLSRRRRQRHQNWSLALTAVPLSSLSGTQICRTADGGQIDANCAHAMHEWSSTHALCPTVLRIGVLAFANLAARSCLPPSTNRVARAT